MVMPMVITYLGIFHGISLYVNLYKSIEAEGIELGSLLDRCWLKELWDSW